VCMTKEKWYTFSMSMRSILYATLFSFSNLITSGVLVVLSLLGLAVASFGYRP
jgi:hypothetical protein